MPSDTLMASDDALVNDVLVNDALIARPSPCLRCRGTGTLPAVSCLLCGFRARLGGAAVAWFLPEDIAAFSIDEGSLPCGHAADEFTLVRGALVCPECQEGQVQKWKTAAEWARQDAKDARQKKQAASEAAKVLKEQGGRCGYSGRAIRRLLRLLTPSCEAHCRTTGKPCPNPVVLGAVRCRLHGGLSAGPVTAEGRAKIAESNRRRSEGKRSGRQADAE